MNEHILFEGENYTLYSFHGRVVDQNAISETHVSGGGGYSNAHGATFHPVVSNTYTTKEFFLINENGKEQDFSFTNKPIPAIRPGHIVEVKWLIKGDNKTGPYVIVYNHSTDKYFVDQMKISKEMYNDSPFTSSPIYHPTISAVMIVIGLGCIINGLWGTGENSFSHAVFFPILGIILMIPYIKLMRFYRKSGRAVPAMEKVIISKNKSL